MRELQKDALLTFLYRKAGRRDSVWWNGELIAVAEALSRANELLPSDSALCSLDEVLVPRLLNEPGPSDGLDATL